MSRGTRTAVLYARVSTDEQAHSGYSLRQQLAALREWCEAEGYEVLEAVEDPGFSGAYLERPGMDRVRDLVESGRVSMVLAQDADRISRDPVHRALLDEEMKRSGARLVALDDWGDESHEGQLLRYMKGWVSKGERLKTKERTRRGLRRKMREGKVIRVSRPPYGFKYNDEGDALLVSEPEMAVIRRIFHMVGAEGASLGEVMRRLTSEGLEAPSGPRYNWHRPTIRNFVKNDLYRPHTAEEVRDFVTPELADRLVPDGAYGLWTYDKRHRTKWRERDENGNYRNRLKFEAAPRHEWSMVPVNLSGAGLSRGLVDAARERLAGNTRRPPTTRAGRFWQLSGGIARCAVCECALTPHAVKRKYKVAAYYRCFQRYNSGPRDCTNTRSLAAAPLEEGVWSVVRAILFDSELVMAAYDRFIECRKAQLRGDPDKEAPRLAGRLQELEEERRGYLRLAARGAMSDPELDAELARVDAEREALGRALREARGRQETIEKLERDREMALGRFSAMRGADLRHLSPERRHRVMKALRICAEADENGDVRVSGVFGADITELLPMYDHPAGEPYIVRFSEEIPPPHKGVVSIDNLWAAAS